MPNKATPSKIYSSIRGRNFIRRKQYLTFLNTIPLIGTLIAILLAILILTNKDQSRKSRIVLGLIVLLIAHNLLESYFFYNDLSWAGLGSSYLHYHLIGPLFLLYTQQITKRSINVYSWVVVLVIFTVLRLMFLPLLDENILAEPDYFPDEIFLLLVDYFISILLNIAFLLIAFQSIRGIRFAVKLDAKEQLNFNWLKSLLVLSIGTYLIILISGVLSVIDEEQWLFYEKIETLITSIFLLFVAFAAMRFPVFAVHGDYRDLPKSSKYEKSSLKNDEADQLWEEMNQIMEEEHPYRNAEYRLNDLAERIGRSLHHVSQVINQKCDMSFSDFINKLRVQEAKQLLCSDRAKVVTILAIAYESGFNSKTAFYNTFKKFTGKTPTEFKKEHQEK